MEEVVEVEGAEVGRGFFLRLGLEPRFDEEDGEGEEE